MQVDCQVPARRPIETASVFLVIADISGYTRYLRKHGADAAHAEQAVGELLESVIRASSAPLIVHELVGDAVSFYAMANPNANVAVEIVRQVQDLFSAFQERMKELRSCPIFTSCSACQKAGNLKLKVALHFGRVLITEVGGFKKIAGTNMIFAHRMLKNSVQADEYLLVTQSFYEQCDAIAWQRAIWISESFEGFADECVLVQFPNDVPLWLEPRKRKPTARSSK